MTQQRIPKTLPATLFDRSWPAVPDAMAVHSVLALSDRLDEERLKRAVRLSLDAEPILGCRFVERWFRPYWRRRDDLEEPSVFEVRSTSDHRADLKAFFEARPKLPLQVLLLRGESDRLCVRLDHHVGDGKATQEYLYLLAEIYNRLETQPDYQPLPNLGDRSLRPIRGRFGLRQQWRILRLAVKTNRELKAQAQWEYPVTRGEEGGYDYASWRLDASRVGAIFEYGCSQRATLSQVLLAAFFLAVLEELPYSGEEALPASMAVDLRRYFPPGSQPAISNLVGMSVVGIEPAGADSLTTVVRQIQSQMGSQRKYLGLPVSFFPLEGLPVIGHLTSLRPYGRPKVSSRGSQPRPTPGDRIQGWIILTHVGALDENRLVFGDIETIDAYTTGGLFRFPGLLGLGMSSFKGALTLHLGCGPTELVSKLSRRILEILPDRSSSRPPA